MTYIGETLFLIAVYLLSILVIPLAFLIGLAVWPFMLLSAIFEWVLRPTGGR